MEKSQTGEEAAPTQTEPESQPQKQNQVKSDKGEDVINQQQIPDHFYDSDLASVNQKDFLSDNQPPKDQIQERKLLFKEKKLHVFKTIVRLGATIDKPARYDKIKLKVKEVPEEEVKPYPLKKAKEGEYVHPPYFSSFYLMDTEEIEYNIGKEQLQIERLVTSMKRGETAVFELEHLETSKKSGIKLREKVQVFVIGVETWLTVIDVDCDGKFMKEVLRRGEGHSRINKHDEVSFQYEIKRGDKVHIHQKYELPVKLEENFIETIPKIIWKLLSNAKIKEMVRMEVSDDVLKQLEGNPLPAAFQNTDTQSTVHWEVTLEIFFFHSIDDVFLDGQLLKKTLVRGVSTAKPDSSSLVYYALKFINSSKVPLSADACFDSDWWEDFGKLEELHCRKSYLDDYSISKMLREAIKRMKPAEVAEIECRDAEMFRYGSDYDEYLTLMKVEQPPPVIFLLVRVYNFTEGKNCFNMELDEKVIESRRKKAIGVKLLKDGNVAKALQTFQNIVSFYGSGQIDQDGYNQKISALMNSILCHMRNDNYLEVIKLADQVLESPKHGFDPNKLRIKGPMVAKVEGKAPEDADGDQREYAELAQNQTILDKCLYRKAVALTKIGEGEKALSSLNLISAPTQEVEILRKQAEKLKQNYEKKSVKMFKNMFG